MKESSQCESDVIHKELLKSILLTEKKLKSIQKRVDDADSIEFANSVSIEFDLITLKLELDAFYEKNPEYDPRNQRWSKEFREIGQDPDINPRWDWLKKSTWTTLEAVNLTGGYRAERPDTLLEGSQKNVLRFLDVDLFVKIFPVNPNENPINYRFKPSDFVAWQETTLPGSVPPPISSLLNLNRKADERDKAIKSEGGENRHKKWREVQKTEHIEAIRFLMSSWPEDCKSMRGFMTGDAIAGAFDDHFAEIERNVQFSHKRLGFRRVIDLAREILKSEKAE